MLVQVFGTYILEGGYGKIRGKMGTNLFIFQLNQTYTSSCILAQKTCTSILFKYTVMCLCICLYREHKSCVSVKKK